MSVEIRLADVAGPIVTVRREVAVGDIGWETLHIGIVRSCFQQKHRPFSVFTESSGQHTTRRPCPDNDEVISIHNCFIAISLPRNSVISSNRFSSWICISIVIITTVSLPSNDDGRARMRSGALPGGTDGNEALL